MHNRLVAGSSPAGPTIISSTEEVEFLFYAKGACLLYMLAALSMVVRFELWGDHLACVRSILIFYGLDWGEKTF